MNGKEAIQILGEQMFGQEFNINSEPRFSVYKKVYESLSKNNRKSILLIGGLGVGKSSCMRIMQRLFKDTNRRFVFKRGVDFKEMIDEYSISEIKEMYGSRLDMDLYIDDIGLGEAVTKDFGNSVNIISEILFDRYELFVSRGILTHLSSNIPTRLDKLLYQNVKSLHDLYGDRVMDRISEMCEIITWKGESLRKQL